MQPVERFKMIWAAMRASDIEALRKFQNEIADFPGGRDGWLNRPWIVTAIQSGAPQTVTWMIETGVPLVFCDDEGTTVLHACIDQFAEHKSATMHDSMRALIAAGADVNLKGLNDWTPLHLAVARGDIVALKILLDAGADPNIRTTIDDYDTPLEYAQTLGFKQAVDLLSRRLQN